MVWGRELVLVQYQDPLWLSDRATGESGQTYLLPPRFYRPYEYQFSLAGFGYLVDEPRVMVISGGTWSREVADALLAVRTLDDLTTVEETYGQRGYDPAAAARLGTF